MSEARDELVAFEFDQSDLLIKCTIRELVCLDQQLLKMSFIVSLFFATSTCGVKCIVCMY